MRMRLPFSLVWLIAFTSLAYPCAAQIATAWPEADQLFRSDPRWLGGDGAFSVDLGNGRVLWLFGDSFVASEPGRRRSESHMPRNTLAIQTGYDPSRASMKFYWRTRRGQPESFFREQGENWLWPMHGVKLGDHLLLFYNIISPDKTPKSLGFRGVGWTAFLVSNLAQDPLHWVIRRIHTPINPWNIMVGVVALAAALSIASHAMPICSVYPWARQAEATFLLSNGGAARNAGGSHRKKSAQSQHLYSRWGPRNSVFIWIMSSIDTSKYKAWGLAAAISAFDGRINSRDRGLS